MSNQNEASYYFETALLPPPFTICGVKLRPFCLGHYLILRNLGNPINSEAVKDVNMIDGTYWLFHALIVCALTYEENLELLDDDAKFTKVCQDFTTHLLKVMEKEKDWNIYSKVLLFKQYISYHFAIPMYEEEGKEDGKPSGIDWTQGIYTVLKQDLGYNESEILNMPMRKLFYEWCSVAERNGCIKVFNRSSMYQYAVAKGLIKFDPTKAVKQAPQKTAQEKAQELFEKLRGQDAVKQQESLSTLRPRNRS